MATHNFVFQGEGSSAFSLVQVTLHDGGRAPSVFCYTSTALFLCSSGKCVASRRSPLASHQSSNSCNAFKCVCLWR